MAKRKIFQFLEFEAKQLTLIACFADSSRMIPKRKAASLYSSETGIFKKQPSLVLKVLVFLRKDSIWSLFDSEGDSRDIQFFWLACLFRCIWGGSAIRFGSIGSNCSRASQWHESSLDLHLLSGEHRRILPYWKHGNRYSCIERVFCSSRFNLHVCT